MLWALVYAARTNGGVAWQVAQDAADNAVIAFRQRVPEGGLEN